MREETSYTREPQEEQDLLKCCISHFCRYSVILDRFEVGENGVGGGMMRRFTGRCCWLMDSKSQVISWFRCCMCVCVSFFSFPVMASK